MSNHQSSSYMCSKGISVGLAISIDVRFVMHMMATTFKERNSNERKLLTCEVQSLFTAHPPGVNITIYSLSENILECI